MNQGAVAVLVAAGTIAGVLLGAWFRGRARRPAQGPWIPPWLPALAVAFVGVLAWTALGVLREPVKAEHLLVRRPVGEVRITRDPQANGADWRVPRGAAVAGVQVGAGAGGARGRDGALQVRVDLPAPGETAAAQVPGEALPDGVSMAAVWVYVEDSDAARSAGLHARLAARMNAGSHGSFSLLGERTRLTPGAWTEVVWAGSYTLELSPALGGEAGSEKRVPASRRLTSLGVRLEAERPYRGSIFVDDLRVYPPDRTPSAPR